VIRCPRRRRPGRGSRRERAQEDGRADPEHAEHVSSDRWAGRNAREATRVRPRGAA
jgi:hypothetical protein